MWCSLCVFVLVVFVSGRSAAFGGVRQWLERKAGTIRQKMMGKRVNYAARTVLAPDALIGTNEVGVPLEFAMKLSIPEKVCRNKTSPQHRHPALHGQQKT